MIHNNTPGADAGEGVIPSPVVPSSCAECGTALSARRLAAQPHATHCVPCLEQCGDVPLIKRFDDYYGTEGEHCEEIYFRHDAYIEDQIQATHRNFRPTFYDFAAGAALQ